MTAPASVEELLPKAIELARESGTVPSRDRLMKAFRIGRPKADAIHRKVREESAKLRSRRSRRLAEVGQKAPARRTVEARVFTPSDMPVSPGVGPVDPWSFAVPVSSPVGVPTASVGPLPAAPSSPLPSQARRRVVTWPLILLALPAFAAVWSGWVGLGGLTGFGIVQPFPGIPGLDGVRLDTAITLPIGVETYGAYALYVWLSGAASRSASKFAMWSAFGSLALGAGGQITYHLLVSDGPWLITTVVACLPVVVLGMGAALRHLVHADDDN